MDDPNDPAYNPSIFPLAPELDRRVKKTLREEFHRRKQVGQQEMLYDESAMTLGLPLQPSNDPANDNDDIMKFVSAALDLSKEAGEAYALATSNTHPEGSQNVEAAPRVSIPPVHTSSCQLTARQHLNTTVAGKRQHQGNFRHTMRSSASMTPGRGRVQSSTLTTGRGLTTRHQGSQMSAERQGPRTNSQDHGWVYFNQDRNEESAINLASGSLEYTARRRRTLYSTKQQHGARFQRYASSNRRLLGTSSARVQRGMQSRCIVKTTTSGAIEKTQATDLSTSQNNLTTENLPENVPENLSENLSETLNINSITPQEDVKPSLVTENPSCDVCIQTILSMGPRDNSLFGLSNLSPPVRGKCYGFHGWSDICFSASTVERIAGVTLEVFDLLLGYLPGDLPGLPPHNSLLLVLMKLKMAMPFELLATIFGITSLTACNIFTHILCHLVGIVSDLIQVPHDKDGSSGQTQTHSGVKVNAIIDFMEVRVEHQAVTEHHDHFFCSISGAHCVKIVVGLLPCGFIGFISQAYVGSTEATDIFGNSDLLHFLENCRTVQLLQSNPYRQMLLRKKGFKVVTPLFSSIQVGNKVVTNSLEMLPETDKGLTSPTEAFRDVEQKLILPFADVPEVGSISPSVPISEVDAIPPAATVSEFTPIPPPATISSVTFMEQKQPDHCSSDSHANHMCVRKGAQRLRSFSILTSTFEGSLLPHIDNVVRLCAALSNLQEP